MSTVINADCIFALRGGKVVEKGTHDELMKRKGVYFQLVKTQFLPDERINTNNDTGRMLLAYLILSMSYYWY